MPSSNHNSLVSPYISNPPPSSKAIGKLLDEQNASYKKLEIPHTSLMGTRASKALRLQERDKEFYDACQRKFKIKEGEESEVVSSSIPEIAEEGPQSDDTTVKFGENLTRYCHPFEFSVASKPLRKYSSAPSLEAAPILPTSKKSSKWGVLKQNVNHIATHRNRFEARKTSLYEVTMALKAKNKLKAKFMSDSRVYEQDHRDDTRLGPTFLWDSKSIFVNIEYPNRTHFDEIFNRDWASCNFSKLVEDKVEQKRIKRVMSHYYPGIIAIFNQYCTETSNSKFKINSSEQLHEDLHLGNAATVAVESEFKKTGIYRHDMIRVVILSAKARFVSATKALDQGYFDCGIELSTAVTKLLHDNFKPSMAGIQDANYFRNYLLLFEDTEKVFQKYLVDLKKLYRSYVGTRELMLDEFLTLLEANPEVFNGGKSLLSKQQCRYAFRLSTSLVKNEKDSEAKLTLAFSQFLEAIGRVAYFRDQEHIDKALVREGQAIKEHGLPEVLAFNQEIDRTATHDDDSWSEDSFSDSSEAEEEDALQSFLQSLSATLGMLTSSAVANNNTMSGSSSSIVKSGSSSKKNLRKPRRMK